MTITLTINGIEVQAEPGMTVLEAARANNIHIPTLCYSPKLRPLGACRMCVVEVEKMRGYPTACTVPVSDGMVVKTETEALQNLRRETLALILSEHPYTCLVCKDYCGIFHGGTIRKAAVTTGCQYCPANGVCELQDLVEYLEVKDIPYPITYRGLPVEREDPFFDRDYNLCVLCGRCVRMCQEVRHAGVLAIINRGSQAIVGTAFGRSHLETNCQFCGACVDTCPTGALADKRGKWEGEPDALVPSVCPYCSVGCTVNVQVKNKKVIRATAHNDGAPNDGQLCVRGRFGVVEIVHNLSRLKSPLVRRDGRMVEVPWDEALGLAAEKLGQYRGNQVAVLGSATATNEENYLLQKFARTVLQTNNVAPAAGYPAFAGAADLPGELLATINGPAIRDVRHAGCIVAIGANLFDSHPILGLEVKHALSRGATLITVDPRQTKMAKQSKVWLRPKVGADHVLLAGLAKILTDHAAATGSGNGAGQAKMSHVDLDRVTTATGVTREMMELAVRQIAGSGPVVIIYGSGVTHHPTAMKTVSAIRTLAGLAGNAGIIGVPGEGNFVGAHDMGLHPHLLPGYAAVTDSGARAGFEAAWGVALNPEPGSDYQAIVEGIRQGRIKALYLAGELPHLPELANLEFLVVQDIINTDNIQYAHVVLPSATFAEMDGTVTNLEGRVQRVRAAIAPVNHARPGWMITSSIAQQMGVSGWQYGSAADITAEIAGLVPAYAGVNLESLDLPGVLRRFERTPVALDLSLDGVPQVAGPEFPLTLITERNLLYYHGAGLTEEVSGMNLIKQEEILHLNPADADRLGIADDELVTVVSPYGRTECIVRVTQEMVPEGVVFASFNRVNSSPLFPGLTPEAKAYPIRIEPEIKAQAVTGEQVLSTEF